MTLLSKFVCLCFFFCSFCYFLLYFLLLLLLLVHAIMTSWRKGMDVLGWVRRGGRTHCHVSRLSRGLISACLVLRMFELILFCFIYFFVFLLLTFARSSVCLETGLPDTCVSVTHVLSSHLCLIESNSLSRENRLNEKNEKNGSI